MKMSAAIHPQVKNRLKPNSSPANIVAPARWARSSPLNAKHGKAYLTKKATNAANDTKLKKMPAIEPAMSTQAVRPIAFESAVEITPTNY